MNTKKRGGAGTADFSRRFPGRMASRPKASGGSSRRAARVSLPISKISMRRKGGLACAHHRAPCAGSGMRIGRISRARRNGLLHDHGLMLAHGIIRTRLEASNYDFPTRLASCIAVSRRGWIFSIRASMAGWFSITRNSSANVALWTLRLPGSSARTGQNSTTQAKQGCMGAGVSATGWFMRGAEVDGEFAINSARLGGSSMRAGARFCHSTGRAIVLEYADIAGGVFLRSLEKQPAASKAGFMQPTRGSVLSANSMRPCSIAGKGTRRLTSPPRA